MGYYFSPDDHARTADARADGQNRTPDLQAVYDKFIVLHRRLQPVLRSANHDLTTHEVPPVVHRTASTVVPGGVLAIQYLRSGSQAVAVERLMGREEVAAMDAVEVHRHPVIEVRLQPDGLAVELIVSPDAWWDQQNLMGKLTIARHRSAFHHIMRDLADDLVFGFWSGPEQSDSYITPSQYRYGPILDEWMSTFEPGKDWLRLGRWYEPSVPELAEEAILNHLVSQIRMLYGIYEQITWTSDNNFRDFYVAKTRASTTARLTDDEA